MNEYIIALLHRLEAILRLNDVIRLLMEIATELLKMRGAEVTPAEDGRVALEAFQGSEPFFFDAVLMDMQMPNSFSQWAFPARSP